MYSYVVVTLGSGTVVLGNQTWSVDFTDNPFSASSCGPISHHRRMHGQMATLMNRREDDVHIDDKVSARTLRYRQELGLVISEFWWKKTTTTTTTDDGDDVDDEEVKTRGESNDANQVKDDGEENYDDDDDVSSSWMAHSFVARHLQQQQPNFTATTTNTSSSTTTNATRIEQPQQGSSLMDREANAAPRPLCRHPGYIPASLLLLFRNKQQKVQRPPEQEHQQQDSNQSLHQHHNRNNNKNNHQVYIPTCRVCFAPIQPGAFGCTTRLVSIHPTLQAHGRCMTRTQKRRQRRQRRQQQQKQQAIARRQQMKPTKKNPTARQYANWYQHVLTNQQEQHTSFTKQHPLIKSRLSNQQKQYQQLEIMCGTCRTRTTVPIVRHYQGQQQPQNPQPSKTTSSTTTTTKGRMKSANNRVVQNNNNNNEKKHPLQRRELPKSTRFASSNNHHKNEKQGVADEVAGTARVVVGPPRKDANDWNRDYVPLPGPYADRNSSNNNNMNTKPAPSALKPKKKKRKTTQHNTLMDFLSSFNDP